MATNDTIRTHSDKVNTWRETGLDQYQKREAPNNPKKPGYIGGGDFEAELDQMLFNRMIKLRNLPSTQFPQGNDPGKIFWDKDNKKYKLWVDSTSQWVDISWTSTSTSTTSSSSSSTSSTSSSSSTSSTSSSSSSSSTSTTTT